MSFLPNNTHPDVEFLYDYWRSIFPTSRLPGRQHFDPLDVPKLLPRLLLIDVDHAPMRFRYRLVGSKIEEFAGENLTGRRFADRLTGPLLRRAEKSLQTVVDSKQPSWRRGKPLIRWEKEHVELERLFLPLARDGETVDMVLAITVHSWVLEKNGPRIERQNRIGNAPLISPARIATRNRALRIDREPTAPAKAA